MKKLLFFALALVVLTRCAPNNQKLVLEVLKTDRDFSQMSIDKGRNQAFIYYAADSVVMPREGNFPILGKQALVKHLATSIDKSFKLRWTPLCRSCRRSRVYFRELGAADGRERFPRIRELRYRLEKDAIRRVEIHS